LLNSDRAKDVKSKKSFVDYVKYQFSE
jgi:hypothetical protein